MVSNAGVEYRVFFDTPSYELYPVSGSSVISSTNWDGLTRKVLRINMKNVSSPVAAPVNLAASGVRDPFPYY